MQMEELRRYFKIKIYQKHDFLYPLIFQEYIYALAHDHGLNINKNRSIHLENECSTDKYSVLSIKRLITRMYQQNHWIIYVNDSNPVFGNKNKYNNKILYDGFVVILEIPFFLRLIQGKNSLNIHNFHSIHSIFTFLEDKYIYIRYVLDILIPYPIHLELVVQILRFWLKDVSSLHLLRFFLHQYYYFKNFSSSKRLNSYISGRNIRFFLFLYNFYVFEYESILVFLCQHFSHLRLTSYEILLERIFFYGKIDHLGELDGSHIRLWLFKEHNIHYTRFQGKALIALKGTHFLIKKWKKYLFNCWQCHFSVWAEPRNIYINPFYNHSINFMGYVSNVQLVYSIARSQMFERSFLIDNAINIKKFHTIAPISPLIGSLVKAQFCNVLGQPISKPVWSDLSDFDIISRFGRIYKNLSHYYTGCSKKNIVYRVKYIFRLSCLRTLARKHKTTIRSQLKKFGLKLLEEFVTEEEQFCSSIASSNSQEFYRIRIWHLDIIFINDLISY
uniref:Maturase K n=1 Tax=Hydrostachys plumosa TaxID=116727 RepID=Q8WKM4_9ASTE|nr:maturase K [Hydrostachys plumosa]